MELVKKYDYQSDEVIRTLRAKLEQIRMEPGEDPDEYFLKAARYRAELRRMDEPITDRHFKDIIIQGISSEYDNIKFCVYRDPTFNLDEIQSTMRNVYRDDILRRDSKNTVGSQKTVMTDVRTIGRKGQVTSDNWMGAAKGKENYRNHRMTCYRCGGKGHRRSQCPSHHDEEEENETVDKRHKKSKRETWCSLHKTTSHSDEECRAQKGSAHVVIGSAQDSSLSERLADGAHDFAKGVLWTTIAEGGETPVPNKNKVTFLVDTGASDTCIDDRLIPGVRDTLTNYERLKVP